MAAVRSRRSCLAKDLGRAGPQPADLPTLAALDQAGQLGLAVLAVPAQGGHGLAGEPALLGHRPVGGQHRRSTAASCQAVIPRRQGLAARRRPPTRPGRLGGEVADQALAASWRAPVGSPAASSIRPRGGSGWRG